MGLTMVIQGLLNKRELSQSAHLSSGGQKHRSALGESEHPVFEGLSHSPTITVIGNAIESMSSLNWGLVRKLVYI